MTNHAIEKAQERYKIALTFDDLHIILDQVKNGEAREIKKPNNILGLQGHGKLYNLRYKGVLMQPVVADGKIVTFNPVGKKNSWHKTQKGKSDKNYCQMIKRKKKGK